MITLFFNKKIMRVLILLPILAYLWIIAFNIDLLSSKEVVNIFGLMNLEIPVLFYSTIFLVLYSILIILFFDSVNAFKNRKIRKMEKQVFTLKSKLYDEREDELAVFMKEQKHKLDKFLEKEENNFEKYKSEQETNLAKQKAESDKILEKLNLLDEWLLAKIKKTFK